MTISLIASFVVILFIVSLLRGNWSLVFIIVLVVWLSSDSYSDELRKVWHQLAEMKITL